mgnify:CR=1 FL=1
MYFTVGGGISMFAGVWAEFGLSPIATGTGLMMSIFLVSHVVELPLSIYQTFTVEEKFGFNRSTPKQFMIDQALELGLIVALGTPLIMVIDRKSTRLNSSHVVISYAVFCLKKKTNI